MAIKMSLRKANENDDPQASKFFGNPTTPLHFEDDIEDNEVFIAQINLQDIKDLDIENKLPHEGFLYFFIETDDESPYSYKKAKVRYTNKEIKQVIDDFNLCSPISEGLNESWIIEFSLCDDDDTGHKLLGNPYDYNYEDSPELLMQFDPLETEGLDFMSSLDGFIYFFFKDVNKDFNEVYYFAEYS